MRQLVYLFCVVGGVTGRRQFCPCQPIKAMSRGGCTHNVLSLWLYKRLYVRSRSEALFTQESHWLDLRRDPNPIIIFNSINHDICAKSELLYVVWVAVDYSKVVECRQ